LVANFWTEIETRPPKIFMAGKIPQGSDFLKEYLYEFLLYPVISMELFLYRFNPGDQVFGGSGNFTIFLS